MYQIKQRSDEVDWQELDFDGVRIKVLHTFSDGGSVILTQMAAGAAIPAHRHSLADETVFVVEGGFLEDGEEYSVGSLFFGRANTLHGPHRSKGGCLLLTQFSAELDFLIDE